MFIFKLFTLFILFSLSSAEERTLFDIIQPNANTRLFDQLSATVELEYKDSPIQFDSSSVFDFEKKPISIPEINEKYKQFLYEGDMVVSPKQLEKLHSDEVKRSKRKAYVDDWYPETIWRGGVPYVLHSSLTLKSRLSIQRAIRFWQEETCIDFRQRTNEKFFLQFVGYEDGCWSTVGRDDTQPNQIVSIGRGCEHFGVTSHELAHALGVFHEQSRYDRDGIVNLNPRVVDNSLLFNFAKIQRNELKTYNLPYDVGSVMHYAPTEFSNNKGIPALTTVDPNLQQTMGSMDKPSFLDVAALNKHYNCEARCTTKIQCYNGGIQDSRNCNVCKCPDGYGGNDCRQVQESFARSCGGIVTVVETVRRFDISVVQTGRSLRDKTCIYHLVAPPGKRVLVNLMKLRGKCVEGCYVDGAEFKMINDKRPVGYRFCCEQSQLRRLVSQSNIVPVIVFSRQKEINLAFEYTSIDASASHDFAPLTQNDLQVFNQTIYKEKEARRSYKLGIVEQISRN